MNKRIPIIVIVLAIISVDFVFPKKLTSMPDLLKPFMLLADHRFIYISDDCGIKIYSSDTFELQKKIGKLGNGPGEYILSPSIQLLPYGRIFLTDIKKYVLIESNGNIVEEKKSHVPFRDLKSIGDNFVIKYFTFTDDQLYNEISILDRNFKLVKNLYKKKRNSPTDLSKVISRFKIIDNILITACYDDKIFLARGEEGFYYEIFDGKGNRLLSVNKPYEKLSISTKDKRFWIEQFKQSRGMNKYWAVFRKYAKNLDDLFPEYYPAMQDFSVSDGNVYIKTYYRKNNLEKYVVLDLKGNIRAEVLLPQASHNLFTFADERFYYLVENDSEDTWELHSEEIRLKK